MQADMPPAEARGGVRLEPLHGANVSLARADDEAQGARARKEADSAEPIPAMPELAGILTPRLDQRLVAEARKLLSVDEIVAVKTTFEDLDTDGSGALDIEEVYAGVRRLCPTATKEQVNKFIEIFDDSRDGQIQLDEFLVMMGNLNGGVSSTPSKDDTEADMHKRAALKRLSRSDEFANLRRVKSQAMGLGEMLNNVSGVQRNDRHIGPRQKTVYINIGGIDGNKACMEWLEGRSLFVEGRYSSTLPRQNNDAGKTGQYKVHASDDDGLAGIPSSSSAFGVESDAGKSAEEVILTTARMTAKENAAIWNQTFQVRVPIPLPKSLRLSIYATVSSERARAPARAADARV